MELYSPTHRMVAAVAVGVVDTRVEQVALYPQLVITEDVGVGVAPVGLQGWVLL